MDNTTWIATIAGIALGITIALLVIYIKNQANEPGVMYSYDNENRLQSVLPMNKNAQFVKLKPVDR